MRQNPYSELAEILASAGRSDETPVVVRLRLGTVLSPFPLRVDVAGTVQEADRFYISYRLLEGYEEKIRMESEGLLGNLTIRDGTQRGVEVKAGTISASSVAVLAEPVLRTGDVVLLLTEDDQTFYLMDKVVKAQ